MEAEKEQGKIKGAGDAQHREPEGRVETRKNDVAGYSC